MAEVRAAVRIRPAVRSGGPPLSIKGQYGEFAFDYVIEENASQELCFNECILPQVNSFLQGTSSAILAYGAGSTGKTYTLEGGPPTTRTEGAIPRAMHAICKNLAVVPKHRYKLYVTYCALSAGMEAQMVDLLAPGSPSVSLKDSSATSALARLLHYQVESHEDIYEVLRQGRMTRAAALTAATNSGSQASGGSSSTAGSRAARPLTAAAHLLLNIQLTGFAASGEQLATNLTFVELSAPEAKDMMGYPASGDSGLTRSLSLAYASLTAVITALRGGGGASGGRGQESPSRGHTHVPWRDSPLTRWLKGCLEAAGSILVIATVAPGPEAAADTLATLSYVNRLRSGPKTDGLIVTATWDTSNGSAPGFDAAAAQQELQYSLQRTAQAQRSRQERERELQERQDRERERDRDRFGSPIQVRTSPTSVAGSSMRPQNDARYDAMAQEPPSLDTRYHSTLTTTTPGFRSASVPRGATSNSASLSFQAATPSSSSPRSYISSPRRHEAERQLQPLRPSDVLPNNGSRGNSSGQQQLVDTRHVQMAQQPQEQQLQQSQQHPQPQQNSRATPLSELLASLELGHAAPQGLRSDPQQQQLYKAGNRNAGANGLGALGAPDASGAGHSGEGAAGNPAMEALRRQVEQLRAELGAEKRETQRLKSEVSSLEAAHRTATDRAEAQAAATMSELRGQVEALRKQLETSEGAKQVLSRRVQQLQEQQGSVMELQAESSLLEAQIRALQDSLNAARSGQSSLAAQLAEAKAAAESVRQERDKLQRQNHELSEKLQAQVRSLSEETSKLRAQAMEAAGQLEAEQVARRAAESALSQLRVQVESSRGAEGNALQQAAGLAAQVKELNAALDSVRAERNKLQEAKWRVDERCEQLGLELDAAVTQRTKADMEARAASTKAASDLRSAIMAAEGLKVELTNSRAQVDALKQELRAAQQAAEDATRRESSVHTDMQEMESLMRELDRDLEVQVNHVWRQLRAERADSLFGVPEAGAVTAARRWRPVLQALVSILKRNAVEAERQSQALEQSRERMSSLEAQVGRTSELATSLAAHQQLKAAHMSELEESRRSIALMDQALTEANRECERLHRQLEELSATHKAFTVEAATRESRLQSQLAEREATLQAQVADREDRLRATLVEHDKRLAALADEWESRLQLHVAERDARLHATVLDVDAKLQAAAAERDARVAAAHAEGEAKLASAVAERDARLQQTAADAEARYQEAVSERDARLAALGLERDALQRQLSSLREQLAEDKQERDMLRLRAHARDQLLNVVWSEARGMRLACTTATTSPPRTPLAASFATSSSQHSSPATAGLSASALAAASEREGVLDWGEAHCQEKLLKSLAAVRVQVGKLQAELTPLRASAGLTEDLSSQLGVARGRLSEAQRNVEELNSKVATLEAELREAQQARSSLQQQLTTCEQEAATLQASLTEARQTIATLQEDVAVLTKSRDTWKDTATQQEAQLREVYLDSELRAGELARLRNEAQSATSEASGSVGRIRLLESQLQDAQSQVEMLGARLAATDKALAEANTRAASLNGQLVLAESEARLKMQEMLARVQAAEDAEKLAKANAKDALERLEARLREAGEQGGRLVSDLDSLRAERTDAQLKADDLQRQLLEARARLVDSEHVSKQLQKVIGERDALQEQINTLRNTHYQATDEVRSLKRQLEIAQEQLARVNEEKTRLAAQVEGQRLDAIMNSMAPRTTGRIGALARPSPAVGGDSATAAAMALNMAGAADASQRTAPASFARGYTGLAYPSVVTQYVSGPPLGATPSLVRAGGGYGVAAGTPFTPTLNASAAGGLFEPSRITATPGAGLGSGPGEDALSAVRVQIRTSPTGALQPGLPRQT